MNDYQANLQLTERGKIGAENEIVCPYCFYSWKAEEESNGAPFKEHVFECYECKKEFSVDCEPTGDYWFSTKPLKEPDPKYIVKLPVVNWNDQASELEEDFAFLILDITSDETRLSGSDKDFNTWRARLTEQEIKSIDERYWAFAVPVEEDQK